jgi:hypothetical protein
VPRARKVDSTEARAKPMATQQQSTAWELVIRRALLIREEAQTFLGTARAVSSRAVLTQEAN